MKMLTLTLVAAIALYALLCLLVLATQRKQIYYPTPETDAAAQAVRLPVDGAELKLWRVGAESAAALIYFGGNAEDVGAKAILLQSHLPERSLYLVNYRGYGGSTGVPAESAINADALRVFDHVSESHDRIAVMGRSLGSGVATFIAANRPLEKMVLITPFDSITEVAAAAFPYLPMRWLITERFDSRSRVSALTVPTLVVIAENDAIIPLARSEALIAGFAARPPVVTVIPGAGHNDLHEHPAYAQAIAAFLAPTETMADETRN